MPFKTQELKDRTIAIAEAIPAEKLGAGMFFHFGGAPCCLVGHIRMQMSMHPIIIHCPEWFRSNFGWTQQEFVRVTDANDRDSTQGGRGNREAGLAVLRAIPVA